MNIDIGNIQRIKDTMIMLEEYRHITIPKENEDAINKILESMNNLCEVIDLLHDNSY